MQTRIPCLSYQSLLYLCKVFGAEIALYLFISKITIIQDLTKEHKPYIYVPWVYPTLIHVMLNLLFHFYCCMYLGEKAVPCMRNIRPEEIWLYKYPRRPNYIPVWMLWAEVFTVGKFAMSAP